jgi:hypothetical protein
VLGETSTAVAGAKLIQQARGFERQGRPVLPALELISTLAQADPGNDGLYRLRQSDATIRGYLREARKIKALLILDIQPGHAEFMDEVRALEPYLLEPDVGLALDPEWKTPDGVPPGKQIGSTDADTVNQVSDYLARLVRMHNLPQKLVIVHQFTGGMVAGRESVVPRRGLAIVNNIDGFGTQPQKADIYHQLANPPAQPVATNGPDGTDLTPVVQPHRFNGFKLFYHEDTGLMSPAAALALRPAPDVVVYE